MTSELDWGIYRVQREAAGGFPGMSAVLARLQRCCELEQEATITERTAIAAAASLASLRATVLALRHELKQARNVNSHLSQMVESLRRQMAQPTSSLAPGPCSAQGGCDCPPEEQSCPADEYDAPVGPQEGQGEAFELPDHILCG